MKIKRNTRASVKILVDDVPSAYRAYMSELGERRYVVSSDVKNGKLAFERYLADFSAEEVVRLVLQAPDMEMRLGKTGAVTFMNNLRTVLK